MTLSTEARERLEDVRELEPTTNGELRERWGMDSGKDVARYLRTDLGEHVYRDDSKRIRARNGGDPEAADAPDRSTVEAVDGDHATVDAEASPDGPQSEAVTAEPEDAGQDVPTPSTADAPPQDATTSTSANPDADATPAPAPTTADVDTGPVDNRGPDELVLPCGCGEAIDTQTEDFQRAIMEGQSDRVAVWCETCGNGWVWEP